MELRQKKILELLNEQGNLLTDELANKFEVTTQTIRRDINALCESGLARRQHGGITLLPALDNLAMSKRMITNSSVKHQIIVSALQELKPGNTVFLSYGSTVAQFASSLPTDMPLTIITNNLDAISYLTNFPNIDVFIAGGKLRHQHRDSSGVHTQSFFETFRVDIAFLGVGGISEQGELLEFQLEEGELTKIMLKNSRRSVLLADSSKYLRNATVCMASLKDIDSFYTDCQAERLVQLCEEQNVQLNIIEMK